MTSLLISRLEVEVSQLPQPALLISRLEVHRTAPSNALLVSRLEVHRTAPTAGALKISRLELRSAAKPTVPADISGIEPGDTVTLVGSGGNGSAGSWSQVSGPTAKIDSSTSTTLTFKMPGAPAPGAICVFRYTVAGASADVTMTGLRATRLRWTGTQFVGVVEYRKAALS